MLPAYVFLTTNTINGIDFYEKHNAERDIVKKFDQDKVREKLQHGVRILNRIMRINYYLIGNNTKNKVTTLSRF